MIDSAVTGGSGSLATLGGDRLEDLVPKPVDEIVSALYRRPTRSNRVNANACQRFTRKVERGARRCSCTEDASWSKLPIEGGLEPVQPFGS